MRRYTFTVCVCTPSPPKTTPPIFPVNKTHPSRSYLALHVTAAGGTRGSVSAYLPLSRQTSDRLLRRARGCLGRYGPSITAVKGGSAWFSHHLSVFLTDSGADVTGEI